MSKGSINTRTSGASTTRSATVATQPFSPNVNFSKFEGETTMSGGYYSLSSNDGKSIIVVETANGYNEQRGIDGTTIDISVIEDVGNMRQERITSAFVETSPKRINGRDWYENDDKVAQKVDSLMPYIIEQANKKMKR